MPHGWERAHVGSDLGDHGFLTAAAAYWYWAQGPVPASARPPVRAAVPVGIAVADRQDVPIYLTGLGTVQASFTIGIHSQVDGKLQGVLFTEGQQVKKGDVLAKIDPRLFQASQCLDDVGMISAVVKLIASRFGSRAASRTQRATPKGRVSFQCATG